MTCSPPWQQCFLVWQPPWMSTNGLITVVQHQRSTTRTHRDVDPAKMKVSKWLQPTSSKYLVLGFTHFTIGFTALLLPPHRPHLIKGHRLWYVLMFLVFFKVKFMKHSSFFIYTNDRILVIKNHSLTLQHQAALFNVGLAGKRLTFLKHRCRQYSPLPSSKSLLRVLCNDTQSILSHSELFLFSFWLSLPPASFMMSTVEVKRDTSHISQCDKKKGQIFVSKCSS